MNQAVDNYLHALYSPQIRPLMNIGVTDDCGIYAKALRPKPPSLRGVLSDDDIEALRHRNAERVKAAIAQLGSKWLLWRQQ